MFLQLMSQPLHRELLAGMVQQQDAAVHDMHQALWYSKPGASGRSFWCCVRCLMKN
jgi:hypothetical protein